MKAPFFQQILGSIADAGRELLDLRHGREREKGMMALCRDLLSQKGEASGTALAREVVNAYQAMDEKGRLAFFEFLATELGPDSEVLEQAINAYRESPDADNLMALNTAVESRRQELIQRMNMAPNGTAALVEMRRQLLDLLPEHPDLRVVDADLEHLLSSWFNRGFLVLVRIDWNTSATILEKLIRYEAVHEIRGWDDLHRRLAGDRRCFAFFHPALRDEPLIFVQVALVKGLAGAVQPLLESDKVGDPNRTDTAVFYSISNCQNGLRGISFGNFLIKQVVAELSAELPKLKHFVTLSPIPGFAKWLHQTLTTQAETGDEQTQVILQSLELDDWYQDSQTSKALETPLKQLCARYLLKEKQHGMPLDPVARFHLGNGARLKRINWLGDISAKGMRQSAGMLVNYYYDLSSIEKNHEAYVNNGKVVASKAVTALAKD